MNLADNFRVALRALAANKLRSTLTMLGIIIGVGAVVALMAIGNGATAEITSQVQGIGSNLIFVVPGTMQRGAQQPVRSVLYYADYELLARSVRNVSGVAPDIQTNGKLVYDKESVDVTMSCTIPAFGTIRAYEAEYGRFITEADRATRAHVVVLGSQTARDLFHGLNPLGRQIKINQIKFEVIGVLKTKGGGGGFGSADALAIVPLETAYTNLLGSSATQNGKLRVSAIYLSAATPEVVDEVMVQVERLLRRQHKLKLTDDLDFTVLSQNAFLSALTAITATLTAFLGFIAAISLVVGGIGIMNIMLVSVTERTHEIGLRKAVGAKRRNILLQFLIETLTLTLIGGILGIALGWLIAFIARILNLVQAVVTLDSIIIASIVTLIVGLLSGVYPAFRASRLNPIDALRYE